jgi:outer membrane lipoprotein carrier protein
MRRVLVAAAVVAAVVLAAVAVRSLIVRKAADESIPVATTPPHLVDPPPGTEQTGTELPGPGEARPSPPGTAPAPGTAPPATVPPAAQPPAAQPPAAQGVEVLRRASAAYEGVQTMRAGFTMRYENPLLRQTTTSRGTLFQRRPDRLLLRFSDPAGDVIVSDGRHFWIYYPSVDAQQVTRMSAAAAEQGGVDLQAQFIGDPVARFEHTAHGTEDVGGRTAHVFTLVPREAGAGYTRLRVWLDARDFLARRFEITETTGAIRRFDLADLRTNVAMGDDIFSFTPPPGVRVVDR